MAILERDAELSTLTERAGAAVAGSGAMVFVHGEPGAGKTTFIDSFLDASSDWIERCHVRVLCAACDPLSTPRPLGPLRDVADLLDVAARTAIWLSERSSDIFHAIFDDLAARPTVLFIDDLHWADQATVDLMRFALRRLAGTSLLVIGALRDEELDLSHPMRLLLGDAARSPAATTISLRPLTLSAIRTLVERRAVDPAIDAAWLQRVTGGNPFFVNEMLEHPGRELPTTVRDAVLARTGGIGVASWDLLHLLAVSPETIADHLLADLGIGLPALRELAAAGLVRRGARGVAFRHDLCRLAITSIIPPGAEPALHRRMIAALEATPGPDAAVLVHHALGARDHERILTYADQAGHAAARTGAHTQAAAFLRLALDEGRPTSANQRADLLERLAAECYLVDRLDDAIAAVTEAMRLRREGGDVVGACVDRNALSVYEWYNADRAAAEQHVVASIEALSAIESGVGATAVTLGHAYAMEAFLSMYASHLDQASSWVRQARELASATGDRSLAARAGIVEGAVAVLHGDLSGRDRILSILADAPDRLDEVHSSGYSNLTFLDVEHRRLDAAEQLLATSIPLVVEHDLPICRVWQMGSRARLALMRGDWEAAVADANRVLSGNCAPAARAWPHLARGLVALRRTGEPQEELDRGWELANRYGEPIRQLPAASALAEQMWLRGAADPRLDEWVALLDRAPTTGLEWSRGELAVWLCRLGVTVWPADVAAPYAALLRGDHAEAIALFDAAPLRYESALAALDGGDSELVRRALDELDRLGADAVAAKARRSLREHGDVRVPSRRRAATRGNPLGLTARQLEVLVAMSDGSTNAELAARLYLSEKTVDHHVSAILTKLAVANRRDAIRRAREVGLV